MTSQEAQETHEDLSCIKIRGYDTTSTKYKYKIQKEGSLSAYIKDILLKKYS